MAAKRGIGKSKGAVKAKKVANRKTIQAKPKPRKAKIPTKKPVSASQPNDIEQLLVRDLVSSKPLDTGDSIIAQDLILCLTRTTRKLGYNSGFYLGRQLYMEAGANIEKFFDVLERFGMGKVLYYPSQEHVIITSMARSGKKMHLNEDVHIFESGLIAGYLSGYLDRMIWVRESLCYYNSSDICQFVAEPDQRVLDLDTWQSPSLNGTVTAIAEKISEVDYRDEKKKGTRDYLMLPSLPLIQEPLVSETSKIFYLAGGELASIRPGQNYMEALKKIACYFDIRSVEARELKGGKRVIRLKYKQYNSIEGMVRLSSSMAVGFLSRHFNAESVVKAEVGSDKAYSVNITL